MTGNEYWPMSSEQRRLWFLDHWAPARAAYNVPVTWRLGTAVPLPEAVAALRRLLARHEALFVAFEEVDGVPGQRLLAAREFPLDVHDLTALSVDTREARRAEVILAVSREPFDLGSGPLVRGAVFAVDGRTQIIHLTFHHSAFDGFSLQILERDLAAALFGDPADPIPSATTYADYCVQQQEWLATPEFQHELDHCVDRLRGAPELLELGRDLSRPRDFTYRGATLRYAVSPRIHDRVRMLAERAGVTPYVVLLAAFNAFVYRQTGQADVVIGSPAAGRTDPRYLDVVGLFVSTIVIRTDVGGDPTFADMIARTRKSVLSALGYVDVPFDELVNRLAPQRRLSHAPVVQVMFSLHENRSGADALLVKEPVPRDTAKLDLTFTVEDNGDRYEVEIEYCTDLFLRDSVEYFFRHWSELLDNALDDPGLPIGQLDFADARERSLVASWSAECGVEGGVGLGVHELVERRVLLSPDVVAVVCGDEVLTYRELGERSGRVASLLRELGVGVESLVGVCGERSVDVVVWLLGVLRVGAAYVPLDVEYPVRRLSFMLADSGVSVVLGGVGCGARLPGGRWRVVELERGGGVLAGYEAGVSSVRVGGESAAYVIYTSGSTGQPKGVTVTHRNVARLFAATAQDFTFGPDDVWSMFHSTSFDVSVWEMWGALSSGGRLVVVPYWVSRDPEALYALVRDQGITVFSQTPSAFAQFEAADARIGSPLRLRYVIFAGEALERGSVRRWAERHGWDLPRLVNMYGITETTVHSTFRAIEPADLARSLTQIGRQLADLEIHVLDQRLRPCPVGVVGEMYVGGPAVARGYLGRPGLTASRFVPDPVTGRPGARLYRSGDLARWDADGKLEYAGRGDAMVKVRGFRVEPAEIEAAIHRYPGVVGAAVMLRPDDSATPRLVAYVSTAGEPTAGLRRWLTDRLPDYMVPARFVELDAIPLTPSGKTDYRRLPDPGADRPSGTGDYVAPEGPVEERLASVWSDALGVTRVGRHDNFFHLGGDSIRSIRVLGAARASGISFELQDLFHHPTITQLAAVAAVRGVPDAAERRPFDMVGHADRALLPDGLADAYPMAALQTGMAYEMARDPERLPYHNVDNVKVRMPFDASVLQRAVNHVVRAHPVLRTALSLTDYSEPLQLIYQHATLPVGVEDLRGLDEAAQDEIIRDYLETQRVTPFDHGRPPLLRMHVHRRSDDVFQWTLTEHHGVLDGWSLHSTISEILSVYRGLCRGTEPEHRTLPSQYRDFIALEREAARSTETERFWLARLADPPDTRLPRWPDGVTPELAEERRFRAEWWYGTDARQRYGALETVLSPELCTMLRDLARRCDASLKAVFLAACLRTIGYATGMTDVLIGVTANGRPEERGGDEVRGLFLNTLAYRLTLPDGSWADLIAAVFAAERDMLPHRRFPFSELQRRLGSDRLVDVNFVYNHFHVLTDGLAGGDVEIIDEKIGTFAAARAEPTNFPLNIGVVRDPMSERVLLALDYHTDALTDDQVRLLRDYYVRALWDMASTPGRRYLREPLSGARERSLVASWSAECGVEGGVGLGVHELVERRVLLSPDVVAVVCGDEVLTYRELGERSGRVASLLRELGVGVESLVGVCGERSVDVVVWLLGVLRVGAAYVPLDVEYPVRRLSFMLADSGVSVVLGGVGCGARLPGGRWRVVELERGGGVLAGYEAGVSSVRVGGESAAYVIYTSGSTGRPKGVTVSHSALTRLLRWGEDFFRFGPDDVWSMFHSTSFDFSVWEMWGALSSGGRLVVVPYWVSRSPEDFYRLVSEAGVSVLCQTPTSFAQLEAVDSQSDLPLSLRWVIFGGEALEHGPVRRWAERHGWDLPRLVNMYGITETTVHVTARVLGATDLREDLSQIGREVGGLTAHVLDPVLLPVPVGAVGELYVGGARLARGYAGRPALTAQRFVADPHGIQPGGRLYRTGDRVRLRPDGAFEYVGRSDDMVNVKGFRVELGEVESSLARHPGVAAAAVTMRHDDSGSATLTGYAVPTGSAVPDVAEVRQWLRERLPEYMLPARLVLLDSLPLTPAGKVDRSALPEPGHDGSATGPAPRTSTERTLCELFAELLGVPELGIDGSFFELGGDSITSIQLVSRARRAGLVIKPKDIYEKRTVRALAEVATAGVEGRAEGPRLSGVGPVPLTPILAWARELGGPMDAFSQSALIRVPAAHTPRQAGQALQALLDHHDALRMVAHIGPVVQPWELEIRPAGTVRAEDCLRQVELAQVSDEDRSAHIAAEARTARASLRPGEGQLVRAVWFDAGSGQNAGRGAGQGAGHLLLLVIHHVAIDGVSWRIVLSDLATAFAAIEAGQPVALEPVATSLRQWAHQLTAMAAEASVEQHLPAWQRILGPAEPPLGTRPLDGDVDVFGRLQVIGRTVAPGCAAATLTTAPAAYRVGVDDILMAALALAMPPWLARRGHDCRTGFLLDVERHGRDELVPEADLSRTVGWFTSIHPVRLDPGPVDWREVEAGGPAVSSAVKRIKEQVRGLPPGGEYGLLRHLNPRTRDVLAGMAAPQVVLNYLGRFPAERRGDFALATGDLALQGGADPTQPLRHTLSIAAVTLDGAAGPELKITWAWPEGVLGHAEVAELADAWITALEGIVASSRTPYAAGPTPSDLTLVSLSQEEIDDLEGELSAPGGTAS